jgi:hypothetical protein
VYWFAIEADEPSLRRVRGNVQDLSSGAELGSMQDDSALLRRWGVTREVAESLELLLLFLRKLLEGQLRPNAFGPRNRLPKRVKHGSGLVEWEQLEAARDDPIAEARDAEQADGRNP